MFRYEVKIIFIFRWNEQVAVMHPALWTFIRIMKDEQAVHENLLENMLNGVPPKTKVGPVLMSVGKELNFYFKRSSDGPSQGFDPCQLPPQKLV